MTTHSGDDKEEARLPPRTEVTCLRKLDQLVRISHRPVQEFDNGRRQLLECAEKMRGRYRDVKQVSVSALQNDIGKN